jgi:hypothetical protein
MATSRSAEIDALLAELAASLAPPQRAAFEAAAHAALAATHCSGCGAAYRILAPLQRGYWDPPSDWSTNAPTGVGSRRPSKLVAAEAIGAPDPREGARDRRRLRAG